VIPLDVLTLITALLGFALSAAGLAGSWWSLRQRRGTIAGVRLSIASLNLGLAGGGAALAAIVVLAARALA